MGEFKVSLLVIQSMTKNSCIISIFDGPGGSFLKSEKITLMMSLWLSQFGLEKAWECGVWKMRAFNGQKSLREDAYVALWEL